MVRKATGKNQKDKQEIMKNDLLFVQVRVIVRLLLKKHNTSVHIYNEQEVDEMILLIRDSFIPAFGVLEKTLKSKLEEVKEDWKSD